MTDRIKINRNSTNFSIELYEFFKNSKWETKYDFLRYYQNITRLFVTSLDVGSRGLLIKHEMGLGKTILSIALAIDLLPERSPILLLTKSLQENMHKSIIKYVNMRKIYDPDFFLATKTPDELEIWIKKNFSFVTMNASNMLKQMDKATKHSDQMLETRIGDILELPTLDGKLLIVDEAHNLFRAITNGSKNAVGLYEAVMRAKNLKIMFFTGTPISSDPFELVPCFNMIGSITGKPIFPESYKEFRKLFIDENTNSIKNKNKFQNRIMGLVSYVSQKTTPGAGLGLSIAYNATDFPVKLPTQVVYVSMDPEQYVVYQLAREREREENSRKINTHEATGLSKPKGSESSTYRVKSRQLSNYCPPAAYREENDITKIPAEYFDSAKFRAILKHIQLHQNKLGLVYSQFVGIGGIESFCRMLQNNGWSALDYIGGSSRKKILSSTAVPNIQEFLDYLNRDSKPRKIGGDPVVVLKYAVIAGTVDIAIRERILESFTNPNNAHGEKCSLLIISAAGAEGLDLKFLRHIHIMEPYWQKGREDQVSYRGIRDGSHIGLNSDEKNVQIYVYLAIPPKTEIASSGEYEPTTDVEIYNKSLLDQALNESFITAIEQVSLECRVNNEADCRICNPTDQALFTNDIQRDITQADPCREYIEIKIQAQEITVDGITYYYKKSETSIYDYIVYTFDSKKNIYKPVPESSDLFIKIIETISERV